MSAFCHKIGASVKRADAPEALLNMNCLRAEDKVIAFAVSGSFDIQSRKAKCYIIHEE